MKEIFFENYILYFIINMHGEVSFDYEFVKVNDNSLN